MANPKTTASEHEKERMRAEIDDQVAEFLRRGGEIDVLSDCTQQQNSIGSVWHQQDEMVNFVP